MNYEEFSQSQTERINALYSELDQESIDKEGIKSQIKSIIETQDNYSKSNYQKKAQQNKELLELLGEIGYDPNIHTNKQEFVSKFKEKSTEIEHKSSEYSLLEARLKKIEAEKAEETERANKLKQQTDRQTIEQKLKEAIGQKINGSKYIIKDLINDGKVDIVNNEVVFKNGDEIILFEDGIKSIFKDNPDLVIPDIRPGMGISTKVTSQTNKPKLTIDAINKMTPEQIKANMDEIRKLAGVR